MRYKDAFFNYQMSEEQIQFLRTSNIMGESIRGAATLGTTIPAYYWDGNVFEPMFDTLYFPVYSGEDVVGLAIIGAPESSDPFISYGPQFAHALNDAIQQGGTDYFLVVNGTQTFYYSANGACVLLEDATPSILPTDEWEKLADATGEQSSEIEYAPYEPYAPAADSRFVSREMYYDFTEEQLISGIADNEAFSYNTDLSASTKSSLVAIDVTPVQTRVSNRMCYIGSVLQTPGSNACWACSTMLVGKWNTGIQTPWQDIWNRYKRPDGGGAREEISSALSYYYGLPCRRLDGYLGMSGISWYIDRQRPIIALCYKGGNINSGIGHTVPICGYGPSDRITVSDSLHNAYNDYNIGFQPYEKLTIYSAGTYYTWCLTVEV